MIIYDESPWTQLLVLVSLDMKSALGVILVWQVNGIYFFLIRVLFYGRLKKEPWKKLDER